MSEIAWLLHLFIDCEIALMWLDKVPVYTQDLNYLQTAPEAPEVSRFLFVSSVMKMLDILPEQIGQPVVKTAINRVLQSRSKWSLLMSYLYSINKTHWTANVLVPLSLLFLAWYPRHNPQDRVKPCCYRVWMLWVCFLVSSTLLWFAVKFMLFLTIEWRTIELVKS